MNSTPKEDLVELQKWFAASVTRPYSYENPDQNAEKHIEASQTLTAAERLQIYHQQYWWRMFSSLQSNFPLLTHLLGYQKFNTGIAVPFLSAHPSRHWSLHQLGDLLPEWLEENYTSKNKLLVCSSAKIDAAYQAIIFSPNPSLLPLSFDVLSQKMALQKHLRLFKFPFNLFGFRSRVLKNEVGTRVEDLPESSNCHFVLWRNSDNEVKNIEIEEGEWLFLNKISKGQTIDEICEELEILGGKPFEQAAVSLNKWIQTWIGEKWLMMSSL